MFTLFVSVLSSVPAYFRTRSGLQAEILALRHQLLVLQRSSRAHKLRLSSADRALWVWLSCLWTEWRSALIVVKPETVIGWHRQGFRLYWRSKSRHPSGRPSVSSEVAHLSEEPHVDLGLCQFLRGSNDHVPGSVRLCDSLARPPASYSFCCDCEPNGGMDGPATAGSLPLGQCTSLSVALPGRYSWRG